MPSSSQRLDFNTATADELQTITGIGASLAERIIAARPFQSLDDVRAVSGVGEALFKRIKQHGAVEPSQPPPISDSPDIQPEPMMADPSPPPTDTAPHAADAPPPAAEGSPPPSTISAPTSKPARDVTYEQAMMLSLASAAGAFFLAVVFTLTILATLNGGLRFARPSEVSALTASVEALNAKSETLEKDAAALRARLDNLEGLSGRMTVVEESLEEVRDTVDATATEVATLSGDVSALSQQVQTLQTQTARFQNFMDGLRDLLNDLLEEESP